MSQRFNKEPINLIHRIPSQKQIEDARPVPPPYGQFLLDAGAACWRKIVDLFTNMIRYEDDKSSSVRSTVHSLGDQIDSAGMQGATEQGHMTERRATTVVEGYAQEADGVLVDQKPMAQQTAATPAFVHPEEVAELRAFLLRQQEDISRLSTQIQELTSLVSSQQQVLVHLGQELEAGTFSVTVGGNAASSVKRSRIVRKRPGIKESQPIPHQESEGPSLNL
jgi:hypothetical protein